MRIVYTISCQVWKIARWVWSAVVVAIVVSVAATLLSASSSAAFGSGAAMVFKWFRTPSFLQGLTLGTIGFCLLLALASGLISVLFRKRYETEPAYNPPPEIKAMLDYLENDIKTKEGKEAVQKKRDDQALTRYLHTTMEVNRALHLQGLATHSRTVISAAVPLEATFVPLQAVTDRPIFDAPSEQHRQLDLLRQRTDLSSEVRDTYVQRLRLVWHTQLGLKRSSMPQSVSLDKILQRLTAEYPVAVVLGTPGSGKSTLLRRLALSMASASLSQNAPLPQELVPAQVPVLIRLSDYAESLEKDALSIKQYLAAQAGDIDPHAPAKLLEELVQGHCLVLFDGLDEITTVRGRRDVIEALSAFIAEHTGEESTSHNYNRFLITSRIVGYEPGVLANYAHYTLLDFDHQHIEQFLARWCLALERYLIISTRSMQDLTEVEKGSTYQVSTEQRGRLLQQLKQYPDLRQLAGNPLILTMITVLHASGRSFPSQRIELYHMVVQTLLTSWNQVSGRASFSAQELPVAERLLSTVAFHLHTGPPVLSAHDLYQLARETMAAFDQRQAHEIREDNVVQFVETLRSSSGLLIECGEKFFCLAGPAFQSYFFARYLLYLSQEERKQLVLDHCRLASWREPLLLMIAEQSTSDSPDGQHEVNALLQALIETGKSNEATLQSNLIFVIACLTESLPWWRDGELYHDSTNRLFAFCGDALDSGRYTHLPQELKASLGAWLGSQAQGRDERGMVLPLWQTWRMALCDEKHATCQEGAVWLLVELASDLLALPGPILNGLYAPLLQLTGASGFQYPVVRQADLPHPAAQAASPEVKEHAHEALLKMGKRSLAGEVYASWLQGKQAKSPQQSKNAQQPSPVQPNKQATTGTNPPPS